MTIITYLERRTIAVPQNCAFKYRGSKIVLQNVSQIVCSKYGLVFPYCMDMTDPDIR